jgi:hypothetical protein
MAQWPGLRDREARLSLPIPIEALGIARATADNLRESGTRFLLSFSHEFGSDFAAAERQSSGEAVVIARDLLAGLTDMADHMSSVPLRPLPSSVRETIGDPMLRAAVDRAFVSASRTTLPAEGSGMTLNARHTMLLALYATIDTRSLP